MIDKKFVVFESLKSYKDSNGKEKSFFSYFAKTKEDEDILLLSCTFSKEFKAKLDYETMNRKITYPLIIACKTYSQEELTKSPDITLKNDWFITNQTKKNEYGKYVKVLSSLNGKPIKKFVFINGVIVKSASKDDLKEYNDYKDDEPYTIKDAIKEQKEREVLKSKLEREEAKRVCNPAPKDGNSTTIDTNNFSPLNKDLPF